MGKTSGLEDINFSNRADPIVVAIANELADLEHKAPIDALRLLILQAGSSRIAKFRAESNSDSMDAFSPAKMRQNPKKQPIESGGKQACHI